MTTHSRRTAVIVGASSGIGEALAHQLNRDGWRLALLARLPGFVDAAMIKTDRPLPAVVRRLFVSSPATAARQILRAVERRTKHAYITKRYGMVAFVLKLLPRAG